MQRVNCTVRLNGDVGNTVDKHGVSPAEIVILRDLHGGPEAVVNVQPTHMDKEPHAKERARLVAIYGTHVVDRIFPGQFAPLPVDLKAIALPSEEEVELSDEDRGPELDADDVALIEMINGAKSKQDIYTLAKDHEVDLKDCEDKLDILKTFTIKALFPGYKR